MQDVVEALTYMAKFCASRNKLVDAETYAMRLQDFGGPAKDAGRQVIDGVQLLKAAAAQQAMQLSSQQNIAPSGP